VITVMVYCNSKRYPVSIKEKYSVLDEGSKGSRGSRKNHGIFDKVSNEKTSFRPKRSGEPESRNLFSNYIFPSFPRSSVGMHKHLNP